MLKPKSDNFRIFKTVRDGQKYVGDICRHLHLQSNDVNAEIVLRKLGVLFKDKNKKKFIFLKRYIAQKCVGDICRLRRLSKNVVTAKIALQDFDLLFVDKNGHFISLKQ